MSHSHLHGPVPWGLPFSPTGGCPLDLREAELPSLLGCLSFQDGEHRGTGPAAVGRGHILAHLLLDPI